MDIAVYPGDFHWYTAYCERNSGQHGGHNPRVVFHYVFFPTAQCCCDLLHLFVSTPWNLSRNFACGSVKAVRITTSKYVALQSKSFLARLASAQISQHSRPAKGSSCLRVKLRCKDRSKWMLFIHLHLHCHLFISCFPTLSLKLMAAVWPVSRTQSRCVRRSPCLCLKVVLGQSLQKETLDWWVSVFFQQQTAGYCDGRHSKDWDANSQGASDCPWHSEHSALHCELIQPCPNGFHSCTTIVYNIYNLYIHMHA